MENNNVKEQLKALRSASNGKDATACSDAICILNDYFDIPRKQAEIKYAIDLIFKETDNKLDIQKFLSRSIQEKELHKSATEVLELIVKLTELFPANLQFHSDYIINKCCIPIFRASKTSARFKEMSVKVIHTIVTCRALDEDINIEHLIRDLMSILDQQVKNKLFRATFELLGILSKSHKDNFQQHVAVKLRDSMVSYIQNLYKDDKAGISLQLVGGAVESLRNILENFTPTVDEDPGFLDRLYECMEKLSDVDANPHLNTDHNRIAFRNMLSIVHVYGHLVGDKFFDNYKRWQRVLEKWVKSKSNDDRIKGVNAAQTFYIEIGKSLVKRKNQADKAILLKLIESFKTTLLSPDSQPHDIRLAIRGFGAMAEACKVLFGEAQLHEYFDLIMQRAEYSSFKGEERRDNFQNLPNYIESLSEIMNQLTDISNTQAQSLESVIVTLMKDFHFLSASYHDVTVMCLLKTFINIEKAGDKIFEDIINSIVWQGVLWSCRHQLVYDVQNNVETIKDWKETITYKKYLPLWKQLLADRDEKYSHITKILYASFVKNLFAIINLLDLSMQKRKYLSDTNEVEFYFTDPSLDLEPVRAENFQILYNLVQIYSDVITTQSAEKLKSYFSEWLEYWLENAIKLALKHPAISAFLYLVEVALVTITRINFSADEVNDMKQLKFFLKFLFSRCEHMSGEYQVAILRLIFQSPPLLLKEHYTDEIASVYFTGFSVGKSILTVAHYAMSSFEKLIDCLSNDPRMRRNLLESVLPHMEAFLSNDDLQVAQNEVRQLKGGRFKKRQMIFAIETDLMRIKKRIILFLGRCSPDESHLFLSKCKQNLVRHNYLIDVFSVKLECNDKFSPIIYLDQIMERVKALALSSSDRSIRITACELLHGLVLYFMGKNLERSETLVMWKQLCCDLIVLGADEDLTVRQLFEPLLIQMMHYFSQPTKILSTLSSKLIESLMEMISHKNNCVQDLSARLLREFIVWLFRQTNQNERESSPVRLLDLFQELKKMSIESNQFRRIGAALAFNNIYSIIKEEESLIDVYWIYLFDVFCSNFKSSEDFSDSLDCFFVDERRFQQISTCLDNLSKDFIDRKYIFQQQSTDRVKPLGFTGVHYVDIIHWLFLQCAVQEYFYRQKCMNMFTRMLTESDLNAESYYERNLSVEKIVEIGEGNGIASQPNLDFSHEHTESIFKEVYNWMRKFLSSLDFYTWAIESYLIPAKVIPQFLGQTVIMNVVKEFISKDIIRSINADSTQASYEMKMNNRNLEKIDIMRCVILIKILDFLCSLLRQNVSLHEIFEENQMATLKLVTQLIFKPQRLGFDYRTYNIVKDLDSRLAKFVGAVSSSSINFSQVLLTKLQDKVIKYLDHFIQHCRKIFTSRNVIELDKSKFKGISFLITRLRDPLISSSSSSSQKGEVILKKVETLLGKLFDEIVEENNGELCPLRLAPSVNLLATHMLKTCLKFQRTSLSKIALFCFDPTKLKRNSQEKLFKGEHFMQTYKITIIEFYLTDIEQCVNLFISLLTDAKGQQSSKLRIINILTEINTHIYKNHHADTVLLQKNFQATVDGWAVIKDILRHDDANSANLTIINFLTNFAMICPYELHILDQRLDGLKEWLFSIMNEKQLPLKIKTQTIRLLSCVTNADNTNNEELNRALESVQKNHFPLRSHEFCKESLERVGFLDAVRSIFQCLILSKSPIIFNFIINFSVQDDDFLLENELQETLTTYMEHLNEKQQEIVLNRAFNFFINASFEPEIRLNVVTRYMLNLIKNAHVDTVLAFFRSRISQIFNILNSRFDTNMEIELINCTGAFIIIEAFISTVPREKIEASIFTFENTLNDGKKLTKELLLRARNARNQPLLSNEPQKKELYRKFQCYSYRALITLTVNSSSSDNPKIFNLTLFEEVPEKNKLIWEKIINVEDENLYACTSQDFESFPKIKEYIVSIKDLNPLTEGHAKKRNYLTTSSIFDHTLSQTLTKSDLTYSVVLSNQKSTRNNEEHQENMRIQMESIPINNHEVMSHLIGVVQFMYTKKISPFQDYEKHPKDKYKWAVSIANSLCDHRQQKNVKIFIVKFIENCRTFFLHFAKIFTGPILTILTDGTLGNRMNFFITDLTTMLISWSLVYKPSDMQEKNEAGKLFNFLLENAYHERNEIFKLNLELLKKLIETWREILEDKISYTTLIELLEQRDKLSSGLQLNAVILSNEIAPWENKEQCQRYVNTILKSFRSDTETKLFQPSAQLLGMCLNLISNDENMRDVMETVMIKLKKIEGDRSKSELLLDVLYGIHKSYPAILDTFMSRVVNSITLAVRKTKCAYMEMFLSRLDVLNGRELYRYMVNIKIDKLLKQKEYQVLSLHIINKSIDLLTPEEFMKFFDDIIYLLTSQNKEVRRIIYEIMIFAVEKYKDNFAEKHRPMGVILKGFSESDEQIQNRVVNFLNTSDFFGLSDSYATRFQQLLTNYFNPSFDKEFLNYATQLLLDISVRHPRSTRPLLTYDDRNNSNFFELPIATKIFSQKSLPPAFVSSQRKQLIAGEGSQAMMIQATASAENDFTKFSPTLDPQSLRQVPSNFTLKHAQNSLLVSLKPQLLDLRSNASQAAAEDTRNEDERMVQKKKENATVDSSLDYLRRRIVNTTSDQKSRHYAMRAVDRREYGETKQRERIGQLREGKEVVLYRRYRYGDFPDFFFNTLAILLPLQALVKKDNSIARDVFITIFDSIVKTFEESQDEDGEKGFYNTINESVTVVMKNSKQSYSFLLSALIEMTIRSYKYLDINPESLGNIFSVNAILFLESQLINLGKREQMELTQDDSENSQRPSKRQRIDFDEIKLQHWIKLIEFNYKMKEYEVINGIFTEKLKLQPEIKISLLRALDSETNGKFIDAMSIYENLLKSQAYQNDTERDFYYNSYFNCLANLSDWESAIPEVQKQLDDYDEIWRKKLPFYQNTILPQLIKGELRKTLQNKRNDGFLQVLEDWIDNDEKRTELLHRFPEEIAMFCINIENYTACSNQLEETFQNEINAWSSMEMYDDKLRQLLKMRTLAEVYNFAELASSPSPKEKIEKMFCDWRLATPTATDSIIYWNDLIAYRREFARLSVLGKVSIDVRNKAESSLIDLECALLNVAFLQKNTDAANLLINKFKRVEKKSNENVLKCNLSIGRYEMVNAENRLEINFSEALKKYGSAWSKLVNGVSNHSAIDDFEEIKIESLCCISEIADKLASVYQKIDNDVIPEAFHSGFRQLMEVNKEDVNMVDAFLKYGEKSLKDARELAKKYLEDDFSIERENLLGNVYFKIGQFYRRVYANGINKTSQTQLEILKATFRAVSLGCDEARLYIPYVLILPDLQNNTLTNDFNEQLPLVPEWMFIAHISQILSNSDFVKASYLDNLILKLAKKYPNAIYFPFKLSYENYKDSNQENEKSNIKAINELLSKEVMNNFVSSLQCLVLQEKFIHTHMHNFGQKLTGNMTNEAYQMAAKALYENLFVKNSQFRDFTKFERGFKEKIKELQDINWDQRKEHVKSLWRGLQPSVDRMTRKQSKVRHVELNNVCSWLENYKWSGDSEFIEIPGQYGESKPFIESHVKIVRFEQRLKVFSSKQKPLELKILGSDGKIYSFIMKYGEDVRQDQRIQQVLQLMSKKFSLDKRCKENRLKIGTYQVIPINPYCGMLQIVTDALTINDFMEEISKSLLTETFEEFNIRIRRDFNDFLHLNEVFKSWQRTYENAVLRRDRQTLIDKFKEFEQRIPNDIISRALKSIASTLESFYVLRKNFITSMAAMNVAHWILGIGDRHLNNIMIDIQNGSLIGIDFGIAFGTAAILQVPELIPFRLTSHFVDVLEPIGIEGMIKKNMQHALKCLRSHSEIILICLEVFVKEPSLDWLMQSKKSEIAAEDRQSIWDPLNRIDIVRQKLNGANPTKVLIEELSSGFIGVNEILLQAYTEMIKEASGDARRQLSDDNLTPEEQVTSLVRLATDKTILATTYLGWSGWF